MSVRRGEKKRAKNQPERSKDVKKQRHKDAKTHRKPSSAQSTGERQKQARSHQDNEKITRNRQQRSTR